LLEFIMVRKFVCLMIVAGLAGSVWAGTFGRVVSIGGTASDLALDEPRGVLYVTNFTANRIEVVSLAEQRVRTSFNVASQPSSLALSPDGRYLVVTHYGNFAAPSTSSNALTVIDLSANNARQTFAMTSPPLGVAFGNDGKALVVTTAEFIIFDPVSGTTQVLDTIQGLQAKTLPQPTASYPPTIVAASLATSQDGTAIVGLTDTFKFRYDVGTKIVSSVFYTSTPPQGPRVVAANRDGSRFVGGWAMSDSRGFWIEYFPNPGGALNYGGFAFDNDRDLLYAQVPSETERPKQPVLQVLAASNLAVKERIQLPENLTGKMALSSNGAVLYGVSESGVLVLPVGNLNQSPRVTAQSTDMVFRGNFCDRRVVTQQLTVTNPGGGKTAFRVSSDTPGVTVAPASGTTPATIRVSVDPNAFLNRQGTTTAKLLISSTDAVNVIPPVRVLVNNREPDQRGTFVNVPGRLVDILSDPVRNRFYILRQDTNEVLVFNSTNSQQIAALPTGNTPTQMSFTFDNRFLLIGAENSARLFIYDLETLQAAAPILMPGGDRPRSVAVSSRSILVAARTAVVDSGGRILRVDLPSASATPLPTLGVFENRTNQFTTLVGSPNGSSIFAVAPDGQTWLYSANADTFTVGRKDFTALSGAYAVSNFDDFVVGNNLLNSSLVPVGTISSTGRPSGFAFVDQDGFTTGAASDSSPGVIARVDPTNASVIRPTRMAEAPVLDDPEMPFTRTLAPLATRDFMVALSTSGFTVLPWGYDDRVAPPVIDRVTNAADLGPSLAPGGLISVFGRNLSPVNLATREIPVPTALGDSCLTINGLPVPVLFVSPTQVNAQMPFQTVGNVTMILRTPGGVSDNYNLRVLPGAPGVFRSGKAGPDENLPTLVRAENNLLITDSNPIQLGDSIVIYLTGLGVVNPTQEAGMPGPANPPARALIEPEVVLGGVKLPLSFAGLTPGQVGVYQINANVPQSVPRGLAIPLSITQAGVNTTIPVRVIK
jgi:uncharacterized protein (TIGR03437 family)